MTREGSTATSCGAAAILDHVTICAVWRALGGGEPKFGRTPAFWRKTRDRNVSLSDAKGTWYDFRDNIGGGILDLVIRARGGSRADAFRWLAERFNLPLDSHNMTVVERADWARRRRVAERVARPIGRAAYHWYRGRIAELTDVKRETVEDDRLNLSTLAPAAQELHRLEHLITPEGIVCEYLTAVAADPVGTAAIVETQRAWADACRVGVGAVVRQIGRNQRQEARSADAA